jgi:hypothetical protein
LRTAVFSALSLLSFLAIAQNASDSFDVFVTPTNNEVVAAGSNFDILWTPSAPAGPVTIRLMQGASELTQEFGPTIACKTVLLYLFASRHQFAHWGGNGCILLTAIIQPALIVQPGNILGAYPLLTATIRPTDLSYSSMPTRPYSNTHILSLLAKLLLQDPLLRLQIQLPLQQPLSTAPP